MEPIVSQTGIIRETDSQPRIRLLVVGDTIPGGTAEREFSIPDTKRMLSAIRPILDEGDLVLFNLEAPLCRGGMPILKCGANFRISPETAIGLKEAGFNVAGLANNHILDFGSEGLDETIRTLDAAGIDHLGAAMSEHNALKYLQYEINGVKIAILNWADGEFSKIRAGTCGAAPIDTILNKQTIQEAKHSNDIVVVFVHAGGEYQHFPSPWIQELYRNYITYGATAVVASHPHIPQGLEWYSNGLIVYSMGDFFFEYQQDAGTCISHILEMGFQVDGLVSVQVHPVRKTDDARIVLLSGNEKNIFIDHLNRLSEPLHSPEQLNLLWEQSTLRKMKHFYAEKLFKNIRTALSEKNGKEFAAGFLFNMLDCQSHSYALKTAFSMLHTGRYKIDEPVQQFITDLDHTLEILSQREMPELTYSVKGRFHKLLTSLKLLLS